ncbi:MAG: hypothetical protein P9M03_02705 [Candidatus Theseobacter exili]|nr:hypothetical protein [Candidatus Theseobacter exili]
MKINSIADMESANNGSVTLIVPAHVAKAKFAGNWKDCNGFRFRLESLGLNVEIVEVDIHDQESWPISLPRQRVFVYYTKWPELVKWASEKTGKDQCIIVRAVNAEAYQLYQRAFYSQDSFSVKKTIKAFSAGFGAWIRDIKSARKAKCVFTINECIF